MRRWKTREGYTELWEIKFWKVLDLGKPAAWVGLVVYLTQHDGLREGLYFLAVCSDLGRMPLGDTKELV